MTRTTIMLDAVGGMAGDMFVAAMIDALPELRDRVLADAACVLPEGAGKPLLTEGMSGGLRCLRFGLHDAHERPHDAASHGSRFRDMVHRIETAPLSEGAGIQAIAVLRLLAEAEAAIHAVPLEAVHFHEIGDWDSLMDVVAVGSIAAALTGVRWLVSDLPRGGGLVRTAHGLLPMPAPATARLLTGFNWRDDGMGGERVTPTGAAILRHLVSPGTAIATGRLRATGTGAGTRDLEGMPNVLRATIFDNGDAKTTEEITVLSFDVDDMTGEEIGIASERLRALPEVRDLLIQNGQGKKNRPVQSFRLLLRPEDQAVVTAACFTETSTIGLRWHVERRDVLPRDVHAVDGIRVKDTTRPDGSSRKAESDDLADGTSLEARRLRKRRAEEAP